MDTTEKLIYYSNVAALQKFIKKKQLRNLNLIDLDHSHINERQICYKQIKNQHDM